LFTKLDVIVFVSVLPLATLVNSTDITLRRRFIRISLYLGHVREFLKLNLQL